MPVVRTDGGRSVYGHVITKFSGMGKFAYPWCFAGARFARESSAIIFASHFAHVLSCAAFCQSLSVNWLRWRIRGERAGNAQTRVCCRCRKQQEIMFFKNKTLVHTCGIDFCHQDVIRNPVKIYSAPSISSFQLSYRSLELLTHLNRFKRPRIFKVTTIL